MRYSDWLEELHSQEEIESGEGLVLLPFGADDPIDYEALKASIDKNGPVELVNLNGMVRLIVNITPCQISSCNCGNDVISVTQISGFTTLSTSVEKEKLLENESLNEFLYDFQHNPFAYYSSSGERQFIEREIEEHFGFAPIDTYTGKLKLEDIVFSLTGEIEADPWKLHNLQGIFRTLLLHRLEVGHFMRDDFQEELLERFDEPKKFFHFLQMIYDLGFLTSRMIGEHFIRNEIEPLAEKGVAAQAAQRKRSQASGKVANQKRNERILAMLEKMEILVNQNPGFCRLGLSQIADMAIEDASNENERLWSQGRGRRDEYLDELRSDLKYRERFEVLSKKTA